MKITTIATTLFIAGIALAQEEPATDNTVPKTLVPVSVFTAKDLPDPEPGKPAWQIGHETRNYRLVYYDKWVYAISEAQYILQFECDPATAKLTYQGWTPCVFFENDTNPIFFYSMHVRLTGNGSAILALCAGTEKRGAGFIWYNIDRSTGKLTAAGRQFPTLFPHHYQYLMWSPDSRRFCDGGFSDKMDWYRFGEDGVPVADGSTELNVVMSVPGLPYHCTMMFSPDWRQLYRIVYQNPYHGPHARAAIQGGKAPYIETYTIDPKTHAGTCISSLELPLVGTPSGRVRAVLEPFSPDGKYLYAIFAPGDLYSWPTTSYYYILARDPSTGALRLVNPNAQASTGALGDLTEPFWKREGRFAFAGDGTSGYFANCLPDSPLGRFLRDPATGILTLLAPLPDMGAREVALDPVNGILFTAGEKITSFKVGGSAPIAK